MSWMTGESQFTFQEGRRFFSPAVLRPPVGPTQGLFSCGY